MKILGFNFSKISIEKFSDNLENLKIKNNIDISEIKKIENNLIKTEKSLMVVKFIYNVNYDPNFAKIELKGNIIFEIDSKLAEEIIKDWKEKKIPEDFKINLFNVVLKKSNVKALQLEDDLNLPLHISLPSLKKPEKEEKTSN